MPAGARFCPACAHPVAEPVALGEERKLATVLFADLVGSTGLADSQDAERTRALLNRFYDAMATRSPAAGGTVEKFVGDAVMAAFGAPGRHEDHAERALHAALSMQRRLEELFGGALSLRIGVNTGEVVVGRPREGSSFVTGDAVNVAARLEQAPSRARSSSASGRPRPCEAPSSSASRARSRPRESRTGSSADVSSAPCSCGRGRGGSARVRRPGGGARALEQAYGRASTTASPHLVTIIGDAGVGKTRLVRELWAWLAEQAPQPLQRTGRCLSYGQGIAYLPLGERCWEHLGLLDTDPGEDRGNGWRGGSSSPWRSGSRSGRAPSPGRP